MPGEIVKISGPLSYHVKVADETVRRHVDGLRKCFREDNTNSNPEDSGDLDDLPSLAALGSATPGASEDSAPRDPPSENSTPVDNSIEDVPVDLPLAAESREEISISQSTPNVCLQLPARNRPPPWNRPPPSYFYNECWA